MRQNTFKTWAAGIAGAALMLSFASNSFGMPLNQEVPDNAFITIGNLDWAWAAPCNPTPPSCGVIDLSFQSAFGWRLPTLAEFNASGITAQSFLMTGGNVDAFTGNNLDELSGAFLSGVNASVTNDIALAVPYFSTAHNHADWIDGISGFWSIEGSGGGAHESLVIRDTQGVAPVPEPATILLFGSGLVGLIGYRMKKARA